jgi:phage/conjugal plasmid C-4 type zinc finger TraR family protein
MEVALELETRIRSIRTILVSRERLPGYARLKCEKVVPQLRRAVSKVHENTYGICDDCDATIPKKRLALVPGATRCIHCQILFEKGT